MNKHIFENMSGCSLGNAKVLKGIFIYLLTAIISYSSHAQELNARVEVHSEQLKSNIQYDQGIFREIQNTIQQFMNNTRWSTDNFSQNEKIECSLIINLTQSTTQNVFIGNAQFQVIRPIFGTDYKSVSFQYVDRSFAFSFHPAERQMVFNEQSFNNDLTSLAAFYSLFAMAVDYDSFSELGGSPYVERLYNLVTLAAYQQGGWSQSDKSQRNRYWLAENMQNQQLNRFREGFYTYHRIVLDDFGREPLKGREEVLKLLEIIQNIITLKPNAILISSFLDAKSAEMVNIFSEASREEKQKAFLLLSGLDPAKTEVYRKIISG